MFENRVLRKIFEPKGDGVAGDGVAGDGGREHNK